MRDIFTEDIQNILNDFDMSVFKNKTFLITGATGLIGKLCVKSLLASNMNIKVIALVRNLEKAKTLLGEHENLSLIVQDILTPITITNSIDYIIHGASTTSSKDFVEKPVETILTAIEGTKNILEFAKINNTKSIVYLSSLEVYGVQDEENITEDKYGYIDILNPRSSYSEGKKLAETLCVSYCKEYNLPIKIARLSQTFGAGVLYDDNRVFAQFAKSIINKENIILHTKGETKRNYCYTSDAITGIFTILYKGSNGEAYNVANKETYISILDMAKMLETEKTKVKLEIDNTNRGYNPTLKVPLKEMYERLIESLCIKKGNV